MSYKKSSTIILFFFLLSSSLILFNSCEDEDELPFIDKFAPISNMDNCWEVEENKFYLNWEEVEATGPFIVEVFYGIDYEEDDLINDTIWGIDGIAYQNDWEWKIIEKIKTSDKHFISENYYLKDNYYWRVTQKNTGTVIKENRFDYIYNDLSVLNGSYRVTEVYPDHGLGAANSNSSIYLGAEMYFGITHNFYNSYEYGKESGISIHFYYGECGYTARSNSYLTKEGEILNLSSSIERGSGSVSTSYRAIFKFDFENCTIEYEDVNESHFKIEKI